MSKHSIVRRIKMIGVYLLVAGVLEVVWAFTMKQSHGFTNLKYSAITIVAMIASFGLLSVAMRSLPLGTAYTIWTGIGAVVTVIYAALSGAEALTPLKALFLVGIIGCVVGLKKTSDGDEPGPAGD